MEEKIRVQVYDLLRSIIDDDSVEIRDDSDIVKDLELSSLELFDMLTVMEAQYGIHITNAMLRQMNDVSEIIKVVTDCIAQR